MSSKIPVAISFTGVANFLGVVGVIGSLIFVGLELRQTQRIAIAGQVQARAEMLANRSIALMQGEADSYSPSAASMNPKLEVLRSAQIGWNIAIMSNTFYQYSVGLLTEEQFVVARKRMISFKANCSVKEDIESALYFAEKSFVDFFNNLPDTCTE